MISSDIVHVISGIIVLIGAVIALSGGVGLLRFPDFYTRSHAVGLTDASGAGLILLGLALRAPEWGVAVRLLMIMAFLVLTSPTASHTLAQAARRDGVPVWTKGKPRR